MGQTEQFLRHLPLIPLDVIFKMVYTKVVTNKSPWLQKAELGKVYTNPASHGEGRFVANEEWLKKLFENGHVATQYCDVRRQHYYG